MNSIKKTCSIVLILLVLLPFAFCEEQNKFTFTLPQKYTEYSLDTLTLTCIDFLFENNSAYFSSILTNEIAVQDIFGITKKLGNKVFPSLLFTKNGRLGYFSAKKNAIITEDQEIVLPKIQTPSKIAFLEDTIYVYYYSDHSLYSWKKNKFKLLESKCAGFTVTGTRVYAAIWASPCFIIKDIESKSIRSVWLSDHSHLTLLSSTPDGCLYFSAVNDRDFKSYLFKLSPGIQIVSSRELPDHRSIKINSEGIAYYLNIASGKASIELLK